MTKDKKMARKTKTQVTTIPLEHYQKECPKSHTPNEITKKTVENIENKRGLKRTQTVEELFKKLNQ